MSKTNKIIKILLLTLLLVCSMAASAFAQGDEPEGPPPVVPEEERIPISEALIVPQRSTVTYDGTYCMLGPFVFYDDTLLKKWVDYQVFFHNHTYPGTATIEVRGVGKFKGKAYTTFEIVPAACDHLRATKTTANSVSLRWYYKYCDGYKLYKYNYTTEKWEMKKKLEGKFSRQYTLTNLTPGTTAKVMVKAYVVHKGETITGKGSEILRAPVKPAKSKIKGAVNKGNSVVVVKWPKQRCTGYEVELSANKSFSGEKQKYVINSESQVQKTIEVASKTGKGKGYGTRYVRLRAFKEGANGETPLKEYGAWSNTFTVNVKK